MSTRVKLSVSLGDYDINRAIIDGRVQPPGVELLPLVQTSPERHWRMLVHREFDVCELSMGSYVAMHGRDGAPDFVAIPVFPHRRFRHSYVFVTGARPIGSASDLRGGRIGIRSWQVTGGVWMKGFLADHHQLPLDSVTWVAQDPDDVDVELPPGVHLERVPEGETVTGLCARGELDGLLYPEIPEQVHAGTGEILRLFPDFRAAEESYYAATGIFPIMHVVVLRRELAEQHPWLARSLYEAFTESKRLSMERMRDPRVVSLAWLRWLIEHERELLGPDPWEYGLSSANRHNLDTFLRYAHEQGLVGGRIRSEDLFLPSVVSDPPTFV
ncbi:ABC transporter substrate-binding protein [Egicoccus sp. AB-alg6-2]|uniref:ABC transporter substrate-binding protein n=1 Tax=Egicoccus sp. AB-alg6-2 TaxID=3242692 RepID=UPI00359E4EBA